MPYNLRFHAKPFEIKFKNIYCFVCSIFFSLRYKYLFDSILNPTSRVSVNKRTYEALTRNVMEAILVASASSEPVPVTTSSSCNAVSGTSKNYGNSSGLGRFNGSFRGPPVSHSVLFAHFHLPYRLQYSLTLE